jgi:hypothetical protein
MKKIISNPQNVADMLNTFVEIIDDILIQNRGKNKAQLPNQRINCCSKTMFLYPVTE